jgi:hypothetical protein
MERGGQAVDALSARRDGSTSTISLSASATIHPAAETVYQFAHRRLNDA